MNPYKPDWKANENLAVGKGATVQEFFAAVGEDRFQIDVAPWGEGQLKINGKEVARIEDAITSQSTTMQRNNTLSGNSRRMPAVIAEMTSCRMRMIGSKLTPAEIMDWRLILCRLQVA